MREILFRGKRVDSDKWVEGYYVHISEGEGTYDCEHHLIQTDYKGRLGLRYEVIPETVGQFTGLFDKDGKRVFEGDILSQIDHHDGSELTRVVKYEMSCGSCCTQVIGFGASGRGHLDFIKLDERFKVIGNIHDDPEMVEVKM